MTEIDFSQTIMLTPGVHRKRRLYIGGQWCSIDAAIANAILALNNQELHTVACCQGDIRVGERESLSIAYVAFKPRPKGFNRIAAVAEKADMLIDRNAIHAHPAFRATAQRVWQDQAAQAKANQTFRRFLNDLAEGRLDHTAVRYAPPSLR